MSRNLSPEAAENARSLFTTHVRHPDGQCICGQPYGRSCLQHRAYAFNALRSAEEITIMTWAE